MDDSRDSNGDEMLPGAEETKREQSFLVRTALAKAGMTQKELAERVGMSQDHLSRSIKLRRNFTSREWDAIRVVLSLPAADGQTSPGEPDAEALSARHEFAERLRVRREELGWSVSRVVRGSSMTVEKYNSLERGEVEPRVIDLDILGPRLGVQFSWLITGIRDGGY